MSGPEYTQEQIDKALTALVAYNGNASGAVRYLKEHGERAPAVEALRDWSRTKHWERYEQIREQWAQKVEKTVENDLRDASRYALEGVRLAVEKSIARLEAGRDDDPARTAANLSRVAQSSVDKMLSISGRPEKIIENRDATELMRGLLAKYPQLFQLNAGPAAVDAAVEDTGE